MKQMKNAALLLMGGLLLVSSCKKEDEQLDYITFEELELDPQLGYWNGKDGETGFESGNAWFPTYWDDTWGEYWEGFAYTDHRSNDTPGPGNQFSSYTGSGVEGSKQYAVFYAGFYNTDTLTFRVPELVDRLSLSNTAYAALAMKDGDDFTKKFGGETGHDPDWFSLIIEGISPEGESLGTVQVYLADYTKDGTDEDYISNAWTTIPLDDLGVVQKLVFSFGSSDTTAGWINVPTSVCIDNIVGTLK